MLTISYSTLHPWYLLILYLWVCTFWLPLSSSPSPKPLPLVTINLISFVKSFFACEVILTYSTVLVPACYTAQWLSISIYLFSCVGIFITLKMYWSIVDLQFVCFLCVAKWFSYIYSFSYSFPLWFITGYWNSSLCYTVESWCFSILYIIA